MTLFKANKKEEWPFNAQYQKTCGWDKFQLHRDMPSNSEAGYILPYNDLYVIYPCIWRFYHR